MELAQLWRCPVTWCTVWKGTAQDCVDHMRRAHDIPPLVKAANLARWFPPWTVSREQWSSMSRLAVSGIVVDTLLFSRIVPPLSLIAREPMGLSVALTCDGCMLSWKSPMWHRYVAVIVDALGILQHGCRGHLFWTRRTGRQIFLFDPHFIAGQSPGPAGLPGWWRWTVHR